MADLPAAAPADHSVRDRMVAVLFAIGIALPGLALTWTWSRTLTRFENRSAAPWPAFGWSRDFPAAFDAAFSDRFGGRDALVQFHHGALLRMFGVSSLSTVMVGNDGWYYWLGEDGHSLDRHYRGTMEFPQGRVDDTVAEFRRRNEWLAARGIAYLVVVVPEKFTIYPEHLPAWVARSPGATPYDRVRDALRREGHVTFVDLRPALLAAKARERLYFKTDSHWNYNGAMVGYDEIMRVIQEKLGDKLPQIVPAKQPPYTPGMDFYSGDLLGMLGMASRIREDDVAPFGKALAELERHCPRRVEKNEPQGIRSYECGRPELPRAVVLRDSMADLWVPMLTTNFSRIVYASTYALGRALIEREKPDIVIDELVERKLNWPGTFP